MHAPNPLRSVFDVFGRLTDGHVGQVNGRAFDQLVDLLDVEPGCRGRCVLLRSPRAGYGKTHLLTQVARHFGASHEFVLLSLADGSRVHPGTVLEDVLRRLCRPLPAAGGLTELDLLARRVLALGLEPLVRSGDVPCQDRDSALAALRERATETFDFHHPNAVTAHWTRENFGVLGPRLGFELSQRVAAPLREVAGWVEALYRFAAAPLEQPARIGALIESAAGGGASLDRLGALLQMLSPLRRIVLVADEMEGLSSDPQSALRLAAFVASLRQTAEATDFILALNRDLWDSAFRPRLSGGLEDRLAEWVIELEPVSLREAEALIEARAPGRGREISARLGLTPRDFYARAILRRAAEIVEASGAGSGAAETLAQPPREDAGAPTAPEIILPPVAPVAPPVGTPPPVAEPAVERVAEPAPAPAPEPAPEPAPAPAPEPIPAPAPIAAPAAELATDAEPAPAPATADEEEPVIRLTPPATAVEPRRWESTEDDFAALPRPAAVAPGAGAGEPWDWPWSQPPAPTAPSAAPAGGAVAEPEPFRPGEAAPPAPAEVPAWSFTLEPTAPAAAPLVPPAEPVAAPALAPAPEPAKEAAPAPAAPAAPAAAEADAAPPVAEPPPLRAPETPSPFRRFIEEQASRPGEFAAPPPPPPAPEPLAAASSPPALPPGITPAAPPVPAAPAPEPSRPSEEPPQRPREADRVDELLRQFRERYGRR